MVTSKECGEARLAITPAKAQKRFAGQAGTANAKQRKGPRYVVKAYAGSTGWSGSTFAYACTTLEDAENCFAEKVSDFESCFANAEAILLIDRLEHRVLGAAGTNDPVKLADFYGW